MIGVDEDNPGADGHALDSDVEGGGLVAGGHS
jgi:hypothetical protein